MTFPYVLLAISISVIWGFNFCVCKFGLDHIPPFLFAAIRFGLTAFPLMLFIKRPQVPLTSLILLGALHGFLAFGFCFYSIIKGIPTGLTSLLYQSHIIFTMGLTFIVFGTKPMIRQVLGLIIATLGLVMVTNISSKADLSLIGIFSAIIAAVFWASGNVLTKTLNASNSLAVIVWSSFFASLFNIAMSLIFEGTQPAIDLLHNFSTKHFFVFFYIVVFSTLIAATIQAFLLRRFSPNQVAPYSLLIPVIAFLAGWLIVDEHISVDTIYACCIVLLGLMINQWPQKQKNIQNLDKLSHPVESIKKVA